MSQDRSSQAETPILLSDQREVAEKEAENTLRQVDLTMSELENWLSQVGYILKPSLILKLHRVVLAGLSEHAGGYRPSKVTISGSKHIPLSADEVPEQVEKLCDYINENWDRKSALHLSAYTMWRLNWIHPFVDGNGRTARAVSYLVLCAKAGYRLPGRDTVPEQIAASKKHYYDALEDADKNFKKGKVDVGKLENLLDSLLAKQLMGIYNKATQKNHTNGPLEVVQKNEIATKQSRNTNSFVARLEKHPVIVTSVVAIIIAIVGFLSSG